MNLENGTALKEFLKNRNLTEASKGLKSLYGQYKKLDLFTDLAKNLGFKWSQIYFIEEILKIYNHNRAEYLQWFILHILYQYEVGNLRTSISTLQKDMELWIPEEYRKNIPEDFYTEINNLIKENKDLFGTEKEPFLIVGNFIYINRIKKYEESFLDLLDERLKFNTQNLTTLEDKRAEAVTRALSGNFLIVSGGPGTGKTTTVVSIIKAFLENGIDNISLAAPTGRAAKRMIESINKEMSDSDKQMPEEAYTLHKLLGIIPNKDTPRYNKDRKIPTDVVIVDEASMVDIHMMYRLFDALKPETKLILVGDKDQLPSVEAGALLGDFLYNYENPKHKMHNSITLLNKSYRSVKGIMDGAKLVINGQSREALTYLKSGCKEVKTIELPEFDTIVDILINEYLPPQVELGFSVPVNNYNDVVEQLEKYFDLFNSFTVLTPSKKGLFGTYSLNNQLKKHFNRAFSLFYHGEPIMITRNDYINGLYNGDRGVIFSFTNGLYGFFKESNGYKIVSISKITDYETAYAGTVHKSQGSEFERVMIIIPDGSEKLLTREILYTALTRAKKSVKLLSNDNELIMTIDRKIKRESGIRDFLIE